MARQIGKMLNSREPLIVNGPEVLSKFVGQSEENVRKLFSAAEAEYAPLFILAQEGECLQRILDNLGYPQAPTLILCDNQCAVG